MATVGFSTGAIAHGDFEKGLRLLASSHTDAIELSALRMVELTALLGAMQKRMSQLRHRYKYISFHAPTDSENEKDLVERLQGLADQDVSIVAHPDSMRDVPQWRKLGDRLCIENMDSRKSTGRTAKELRPFFEQLPEARLCFDVGHAKQVDPTMTEASRILSEFGDRLAQVHMSEVNGKGKHFAMSFIARRAFESFAEELSSVPVILESPMNSEAGIRTEIDVAKSVLTHHHKVSQTPSEP
mgnify:CR=1 FL=1